MSFRKPLQLASIGLRLSFSAAVIPVQVNGQTHCQRIPLGHDDSSGSGPHSWHMLWYVALHIVLTRSQLQLLTHTTDGSVAGACKGLLQMLQKTVLTSVFKAVTPERVSQTPGTCRAVGLRGVPCCGFGFWSGTLQRHHQLNTAIEHMHSSAVQWRSKPHLQWP